MFIGLRLSGHNATSSVLNDGHRTFICDMCSTEYKCVYGRKRQGVIRKKANFTMSSQDISDSSFHMFVSEKYVEF